MRNNVTITDKELREVLGQFKKGGTGQYIATCPFCGKEGHFYINRLSQLFDCKRCGEEGNIVKLLKHAGKLYMIGEFKSIDRKKISLLGELALEDDEEIELNPPKRKLPYGFTRLKSDPYWNDRGFTKKDFNKYKIGETNMFSKFENYSIISVEENGVCVGYLARIKLDKKQIKIQEAETERKVLRYRNDKGAKFSHLLLGIDEINENTDTVILLEGFPDKVTLDRILELDNQDEIKCCCTFGKKLSMSQLLKLLSKGIKNVILIFDYDAIKEMKKYGSKLSELFSSVLIGFTFGKDINDSTEQEVLELFGKLKTPETFKRKTVKTLR